MSIPSFAPLSVSPIPSLPDEVNQIRLDTAGIVSEHIIPNEEILGDFRNPKRQTLYHDLQEYVKSCNLWAPHLPKEYGGVDMGFLGLAYMNEIMAWSPFSGGIFGIQAPNSGNMKILIKYGTEEQKKKWLDPLVRGETQSGFSMT
ncbi:MAG: acyl-CoA dehydrogenase family protein, partial [Pseudomonadales bacterium]|nr:acyl-CoA dehydrogenase family protein [Pseudomonadales bacterium]